MKEFYSYPVFMRFSFLLGYGAFVAVVGLFPTLCHTRAALAAGVSTEAPIEISAEQGLEWRKSENLYLALGNARATRGAMTVTADTLTAHERETTEAGPKKTEATGSAVTPRSIDRMTAQGSVHIKDDKQEIFGDLAVYDLDKGTAQITGRDLKYISNKDLVTASGALEYDETGRKATARGQAKAIRDGNHVEGDTLTAHFAPSNTNATTLSRIDANGHVKIITGTTVAYSDSAVHDIQRNIATLSGHVRISRDGSQLAGDKAEIDFATGRSRLLNENAGQRVKALLLPSQKNANAAPTATSVKRGP